MLSTLPGKIHLIRLIFFWAAALLVVVDATACSVVEKPSYALLLALLAYPLLTRSLTGKQDPGHKVGQLLFVLDAFLIGLLIAELALAALASAWLILVILFNCMVVGGIPLSLLGLVALAGGWLALGAPQLHTPLVSTPACAMREGGVLLFACAYFLVAGHLLHRLVKTLRRQQVHSQARSDAAQLASTQAEKALLAVLPPSAADTMQEMAALPDTHETHATLLLLELGPLPPTSAIERMRQALSISEQILARHGCEIVKTFHRFIFAHVRPNTRLEAAVAAFREIRRFAHDHGDAGLDVRGFLLRGALDFGLVAPARLNYDAHGAPLESFWRLWRRAAAMPPALYVSIALKNDLDLTGADIVWLTDEADDQRLT